MCNYLHKQKLRIYGGPWNSNFFKKSCLLTEVFIINDASAYLHEEQLEMHIIILQIWWMMSRINLIQQIHERCMCFVSVSLSIFVHYRYLMVYSYSLDLFFLSFFMFSPLVVFDSVSQRRALSWREWPWWI